MSKQIETLEKRKERLDGELKSVIEQLELQKKKVTDKQAEVKRCEMEIIARLLVENQMSVSDLVDFFGNKPSNHSETENRETHMTEEDY